MHGSQPTNRIIVWLPGEDGANAIEALRPLDLDPLVLDGAAKLRSAIAAGALLVLLAEEFLSREAIAALMDAANEQHTLRAVLIRTASAPSPSDELEQLERLAPVWLLAHPLEQRQLRFAARRFIDGGALDARAADESHHLIEKMNDASPTMINVYDLRARRSVYENRRLKDFFYGAAGRGGRAAGNVFARTVHPADVSRYKRIFRELNSNVNGPVTTRIRVFTAQGGYRWVRIWSVPFRFTAEGGVHQVMHVAIDVTKEFETEERLRRNDRLASIGTLAAGIAHEVNNPLASVMMTAQLLHREADDDKTRQMLRELVQDAKRCARIVRSVQQFARGEGSDRTEINLNEIVTTASELTATELRHAGISLELRLAERALPVVADETEMKQVVVNLLTNAAHASAAGQSIYVRTRCDEERADVIVTDQGCGMSEDVLKHIFDPFYTTRVQEGGTGLGLSIAHGIVDDLGGSIEVRSEEGAGTTFRVSLPIVGMRANS